MSLERKVGARTVTVVILTESRHRCRRTTKNDRDEGDHRPLVQRHSLCDECIITSIFVLFLCLREPTKKKKKKKKKKLKKWGGPSRPSRPACDGLAVVDVIVVSAVAEALEETVSKWCSLFASRNQPSSTPWPLLLIATRLDQATMSQKHAVKVVYNKIKQAFGDYFRFPFSNPFFIDARKSWADSTMVLREALRALHQELVNGDELPGQPAICKEITQHLPVLREHFGQPVISKEKFVQFMQPYVGGNDYKLVGADEPNVVQLFDKALRILSGTATVLSFCQPPASDHVIIDPPWLLSDIVGRLMSEPPLPQPFIDYENGYADRSEVLLALTTSHLQGDVALGMTADLGFCLAWQDKVLNPSKLRGYKREDQWRIDSSMTVHAGRRLTCKGVVAIASAFFPHLQVHFYHRYLADYKEALPMWSGGIRLVAGKRSSAEALIEAHPALLSIDIITRGRDGSEAECAKLLHELTEETLQKAGEITPGSQLTMHYLSSEELCELAVSRTFSRPKVTYTEDNVRHAIEHEQHVTDGRASRAPEEPRGLLVWTLYQGEISCPDAIATNRLTTTRLPPLLEPISAQRWAVVLRHRARVINTFSEADCLAEQLSLNARGEDVVVKLREQNPRLNPSDVAAELFKLWLLGAGSQQTSEEKRETLYRIFRAELRRPDLAEALEADLQGGGLAD